MATQDPPPTPPPAPAPPPPPPPSPARQTFKAVAMAALFIACCVLFYSLPILMDGQPRWNWAAIPLVIGGGCSLGAWYLGTRRGWSRYGRRGNAAALAVSFAAAFGLAYLLVNLGDDGFASPGLALVDLAQAVVFWGVVGGLLGLLVKPTPPPAAQEKKDAHG